MPAKSALIARCMRGRVSGAPFDVVADLVDMKLHGLGVREGQRQSCSDATRQADGAEQVALL